MKIDLHIHTTASDGTLAPEALILEVKENEIGLFSVTDHDCMDNVTEMAEVAVREGISFIKGIELSATFMDKEIHLLTYGIDPQNQALQKRVSRNQTIREDHNRALIEYVSKIDNRCTLEGYDAFMRDPSLGGWKAVNYLSATGVTKSLAEFFAIIKEMNKPLIFDPIEEVLPELAQMGYTVVLAHPPAYFGGENISEAILDQLRGLGIKGIECYSPYYKNDTDFEYYKQYCIKHDLIVTCGSDYHGTFIPSRQLATPEITEKEVSFEQLLKLVR